MLLLCHHQISRCAPRSQRATHVRCRLAMRPATAGAMWGRQRRCATRPRPLHPLHPLRWPRLRGLNAGDAPVAGGRWSGHWSGHWSGASLTVFTAGSTACLMAATWAPWPPPAPVQLMRRCSGRERAGGLPQLPRRLPGCAKTPASRVRCCSRSCLQRREPASSGFRIPLRFALSLAIFCLCIHVFFSCGNVMNGGCAAAAFVTGRGRAATTRAPVRRPPALDVDGMRACFWAAGSSGNGGLRGQV
jgi:hypothetical protein